MKFNLLIATLFSLFAFAMALSPNAERIARGLSPLPPVARSPTAGAKRATTSPVPGGSCPVNTQALCCATVHRSTDSVLIRILKSLGISISSVGSGDVGVTCSPITKYSGKCWAKPLCCKVNKHGLVALGCSTRE